MIGIKLETSEKMLEILSDTDKKTKGGRRNKLNLREQLLVTLEYIQECRTYFHIGKSYDLSESTVYKEVRRVENTLIKHPAFALPGRKRLINDNYDTILIDTTEHLLSVQKKAEKLLAQPFITIESMILSFLKSLNITFTKIPKFLQIQTTKE